jgi:hypothetical protein
MNRGTSGPPFWKPTKPYYSKVSATEARMPSGLLKLGGYHGQKLRQPSLFRVIPDPPRRQVVRNGN